MPPFVVTRPPDLAIGNRVVWLSSQFWGYGWSYGTVVQSLGDCVYEVRWDDPGSATSLETNGEGIRRVNRHPDYLRKNG